MRELGNGLHTGVGRQHTVLSVLAANMGLANTCYVTRAGGQHAHGILQKIKYGARYLSTVGWDGGWQAACWRRGRACALVAGFGSPGASAYCVQGCMI
jgi:hypothetical protein